jgi:hypothetical protein
MLDKFFIWVGRNRKEISLTIGGVNLLAGLSSLINGDYGLAIVGFTIGGALILDAYKGI